jgi:hypothetical protein
VRQALRFAHLTAVFIDRHRDERLDAVIVVDPAPDLTLMFVAGGPVVKVGVSAEQSSPWLELVCPYRSYLPGLHDVKLPPASAVVGLI